MTKPLVSIITPTFGREPLLPLIYACVKSQDWPEIEWLVDDDSQEPSAFMLSLNESWINYKHSDTRASVGQKRNRLISRARGEYIVHFDDDDYYSDSYVTRMISWLVAHDADICKLSGFYLFHPRFGTLGYWDLLIKTGIHFVWTVDSVKTHFLTTEDNLRLSANHFGYGFSYVFKKSVWKHCQFPDLDWNEDGEFMSKAVQSNSLIMLPDQSGICLHIVHGNNSSRCFPQFLLPPFLMTQLFPSAKQHLQTLNDQACTFHLS
jgi:glycosyltransferase involved in cell wall biosynthesis